MKNKHKVHPLLHSLLPVAVTIAYILIGYLFNSGWAIGWILFLLIPIIETLVYAIQTKDATKFAYPVFIAAIFLFCGMMWGLWHPMWVLFVTIPAYYSIAGYYAKERKKDNDESISFESQEPNVYTPKKDTSVIKTIIISVSVVVCVAIISSCLFLGDNVQIHSDIFGHDRTNTNVILGNSAFSTKDIDSIEINWINGKIDICYYDGNEIIVTENGANDKYPMNCSIIKHELCIDEFSGKDTISKFKTKNLSVQIPSGFRLKKFELNSINANTHISDLNVKKVDFETVTGNIQSVFAIQPDKIDLESVSGDMIITLPANTTGYLLSPETLSGKINIDNLEFGDRSTEIDFESVSGDLSLYIAS